MPELATTSDPRAAEPKPGTGGEGSYPVGDFGSTALLAYTLRIRKMYDGRRLPGELCDLLAYEHLLTSAAHTPQEAAYRVAELLPVVENLDHHRAEYMIEEFCDVIDVLLTPDCDPAVAAAQVDGLALRAGRVGFGTQELEASARDLRAMAQTAPLAAAA